MSTNFTNPISINISGGVPGFPSTVPYGFQDTVSVYIKDSTLGEKNFTDFMVSYDFTRVMNQIATGTIQLLGLDDSDRDYLNRKNIVKIFVGNTLFYVYEISRVSFDTTGSSMLTLQGREIKANRVLTDRSTFTYEDILSETITTDLISGIFSTGAVESFGKVFFRSEYDRKLRGLMQQADYHQADWFMSWKENESYDTDYYNIKQQRGISESKHTLRTAGEGQNVWLMNRGDDMRNVANHVTIIGAGSGTQQIISVNFRATNNRTKLNGGDSFVDGGELAATGNVTVISTAGFPASGDIKIGKEEITYSSKSPTVFTVSDRGTNGTTAAIHQDRTDVLGLDTLIVDDTSSLDSSGTLWVGTEKITYSATPTSTTITITARGAESTTAYAHSDNIEVYDSQYTTGSPETGSTIDTEGLVEKKFDFTSVIDRNSADLIAQQILGEEEQNKLNIAVLPMDLYEMFEHEIELGDWLTLVDSDAELQGLYETQSYHLFKSMGGPESLEMEMSKASRSYITDLANTSITAGRLASYAKGSLIPIKADMARNCQSGKDLTLNVYLPPETIAVKSMKLMYSTSAYRAFTTTSVSNSPAVVESAHERDLTNFTCTTSFTAADTQLISDASSMVLVTVVLMNTSTSWDDTQVFCLVNDGSTDYPSAAGVRMGKVADRSIPDNTGTGTAHNHSPSVGDKFIVTGNGSATTNANTADGGAGHTHPAVTSAFVETNTGAAAESTTGSESAHTHSIVPIYSEDAYTATILVPGDMDTKTLSVQLKKNSGDNKSCDVAVDYQVIGKHTHAMNYGIDETTGNNHGNITIDVDGTAQGDTFTVDQSQEIDLNLSTIEWRPGQWHEINIKPSGTCFLDGTFFGLVFIKDS